MAKSPRKRTRLRDIGLFTYDTNLILAVVFLTVFGLIMIYSASYYITSMSEKFRYDPAYFLKNQLKWSLVGIAAMMVVANLDYHTWRYFALIGFVISVVLILLLKTPLGVTVKGATRWLQIPGLGQFQVAEPIKVAMILFSAFFITKTASSIRHPGYIEAFKAIGIVMLPVVFVFVLIWKLSNNMSTAIIVLGISCIMIFMVYPRYWPFFLAGILACIGVTLYLQFLQNSPGDAEEGFRSMRILAWLNPYAYESDKAYQSLQALYAIGSGGFFGKGLGNSAQKMIIPEVQNDMILSIICEELGVFGAIVILLLFGMLLYRLLFIAQNAPDLYGSLVVTGIFVHIALQVILNVAVVINLIPTTGITLPFISYGGTSILFLMAEMGIALGVSRRIQFSE